MTALTQEWKPDMKSKFFHFLSYFLGVRFLHRAFPSKFCCHEVPLTAPHLCRPWREHRKQPCIVCTSPIVPSSLSHWYPAVAGQSCISRLPGMNPRATVRGSDELSVVEVRPTVNLQVKVVWIPRNYHLNYSCPAWSCVSLCSGGWLGLLRRVVTPTFPGHSEGADCCCLMVMKRPKRGAHFSQLVLSRFVHRGQEGNKWCYLWPRSIATGASQCLGLHFWWKAFLFEKPINSVIWKPGNCIPSVFH